ncbi:hypothetical protein AVEN_219307-1 [Araneus ventricosus]|uniref:Retrotransposon gag domain-containing protein n=1 Tax=Araneus ventricosus TaxID=182803 RepID=A0A4Y2BFW9_ARAVE|nr:hypothetical protein AVEN_219307-1 [Araneus ventricosus]
MYTLRSDESDCEKCLPHLSRKYARALSVACVTFKPQRPRTQKKMEISTERGSPTTNYWDDSVRLANAVFYLSGTAMLWFDNNEDQFKNWSDFERLLRRLSEGLKI